jgi:putative addiction module component (TIGR02574 family)
LPYNANNRIYPCKFQVIHVNFADHFSPRGDFYLGDIIASIPVPWKFAIREFESGNCGLGFAKLACRRAVSLVRSASAMTLRLLEKEVLELPPRSRVRLAERIIESIDDFAAPELEVAWDDEIERRVEEIQSGADKGIPAKDVMKEARRALNETRRLPSAAKC